MRNTHTSAMTIEGHQYATQRAWRTTTDDTLSGKTLPDKALSGTALPGDALWVTRSTPYATSPYPTTPHPTTPHPTTQHPTTQHPTTRYPLPAPPPEVAPWRRLASTSVPSTPGRVRWPARWRSSAVSPRWTASSRRWDFSRGSCAPR